MTHQSSDQGPDIQLDVQMLAQGQCGRADSVCLDHQKLFVLDSDAMGAQTYIIPKLKLDSSLDERVEQQKAAIAA